MISAMLNRAKGLWPNLSHSLGFIPGVIVLFFGALGIGLVELDRHLDLAGSRAVFEGDGAAARTVLSVIAGSLITVAGLTFSITMVVLQLASTQFSPRVLRTFFGDRVTQVTIGAFVGTFVYAILVLRAVGAHGDADFVPRLSVTVASLLGIAAVALLVVFLNHVSLMVQVSHVTAGIARDTLARTEVLFADDYDQAAGEGLAEKRLDSWRAEAPGRVFAGRPGYVQQVGIDELFETLDKRAERVAILLCPGDFVSIETPIAEIWPADAAEPCGRDLLDAVSIARERDLRQDVDFGVRQLADTAMRAMSSSINDPATAVTCIGYLRSVLVRLTQRAPLPSMRQLPERNLKMVLRQRRFDEYFESMLQLNRYVDGDAWVIGEMLQALEACAQAAVDCGATERVRTIQGIADTIAKQGADQAKNGPDRRRIEELRSAFDSL